VPRRCATASEGGEFRRVVAVGGGEPRRTGAPVSEGGELRRAVAVGGR
jgi:hypothetical protein